MTRRQQQELWCILMSVELWQFYLLKRGVDMFWLCSSFIPQSSNGFDFIISKWFPVALAQDKCGLKATSGVGVFANVPFDRSFSDKMAPWSFVLTAMKGSSICTIWMHGWWILCPVTFISFSSNTRPGGDRTRDLSGGARSPVNFLRAVCVYSAVDRSFCRKGSCRGSIFTVFWRTS